MGVWMMGPSGPVDCMAYTHSMMAARSALLSLCTASADDCRVSVAGDDGLQRGKGDRMGDVRGWGRGGVVD